MRAVVKATIVTVAILATLSVHHTSYAGEPSSSEDEEGDPSIPLTVLAEFTWYDPALCAEQPINCSGDPMHTAGGYLVPDWYEKGIACPMEIPLGTTAHSPEHGELTCIDRGGSIVVTDDGVFRLDLLHSSSLPAIPRNLTPITFNLTEDIVQAIMAKHEMPFVEPDFYFACPADSCNRIFYRFGQAVTNPYTRETYIHIGTDFYTGSGGPVYAAASGVVTYSNFQGGTGYGCGGTVRIDHDFGWETVYCHLTERLVSVGDYVLQGQMLGKAGRSGYTLEGEHVHVALYRDGAPQNFETFLGESDQYYPMTLEKLNSELIARGMLPIAKEGSQGGLAASRVPAPQDSTLEGYTFVEMVEDKPIGVTIIGGGPAQPEDIPEPVRETSAPIIVEHVTVSTITLPEDKPVNPDIETVSEEIQQLPTKKLNSTPITIVLEDKPT